MLLAPCKCWAMGPPILNIHKNLLQCNDDVVLCRLPYRKLFRVQKNMCSDSRGEELQSLGHLQAVMSVVLGAVKPNSVEGDEYLAASVFSMLLPA